MRLTLRPMRSSWLILLAVAAFVLSGCKPKGADEPASDLWLRAHFSGTTRVGVDTNSTTLREIAALPACRELGEALAQKLVTSLQQTLLRTTNAPKPDAADLIRPLFDEALIREFVFECHGRAEAPTAWVLAVSLEKDLARRWETNYRALVARFDLGEIKKFNARSFGGWYVTQADKRFIDYLEIGKWVIVGIGTDRRPMQAVLESIDKKGRPVPALADAWFKAEGDLARFRKWLPLGQAWTWPRFDLAVSARNSNLITRAQLTFPQPLRLNPPAWNVPTNLVQDPLISFTALRGIKAMVESLPFYQKLALTNSPSQAVFWAQSQIPFQSHIAVPLPGSRETLQEISRRLPLALGTNMQERAFGEIRWATNRADLIWAGLPIVVPYLRAVPGPAGEEFLFGGLFPPRDTRQPVPADLLQQLDRPNLVYYDWEITEERLQQWRQLWQLWALATFQPSLQKPIAQAKCLEAIASRLGNTVTEISQTGPGELTFLRKSHLGFTGVELLLLSRALDRFVSGPPPKAPAPPGGGALPPAK